MPADGSILLPILERFGLPIAFLGVVLWALVRVGRWFGPRIEALLARHERFLDRLEADGAAQRQVLDRMESNQARMIATLERFTTVVANGNEAGPT